MDDWTFDEIVFDVEVIRLRLNRSGLIDFDAGIDEMKAGLDFLRGLGFVSAKHHFLGATVFFQVTSKGILSYERNLKSPTVSSEDDGGRSNL